jgi:hypothetical protein
MPIARVQSVDALKHFRVALWKFAEAANVALGDSEGEIQRTLMWLQGEQQQFWTTQIRKRHEKVNQCKDAVRQKKLFKDSTGKTQSAVDEEKALAKAQKLLAEAEQKLINTRRHAGKVQKELHSYKGAVQRFSTAVSSDLPNAVATLDRMVHSLEAYLSLTAAGATAEWTPPPLEAGATTTDGASMARAADGEIEKESEAPAEDEVEQAPAAEQKQP